MGVTNPKPASLCAHHPPLSSVTTTPTFDFFSDASNMVLCGFIIPTEAFQSQKGCELWLDAAEVITSHVFLSRGLEQFLRLDRWCWVSLASASEDPV